MHFWKSSNLLTNKHITEPDHLLNSAILEILKRSSDEIDEEVVAAQRREEERIRREAMIVKCS